LTKRGYQQAILGCKGVFKEAERSGLQEKHRINIKNKLGGASTSFNQGGEL